MEIQELYTLLTKFNKNWFDYTISEYNSSQEIYNSIIKIPFFSKTEINNLPNEIKYLCNQRVFQRLNYIKQLSFIYLFYPGGCHSRLEHTLGTLCTGKNFLEHIKKNNSVPLEKYEELGLLVALFIHDSCHGPFGHSLELIKKFLVPDDYSDERIDKILLKKYLIDQNNSIRKAIDQISPIDKEEFSKFLISLFNRDDYLNNYNGNVFLIEILNSLIDVDRLDYIRRDRLHIGIPSNLIYEVYTDLFSNIKIINKWEICNNKLICSVDIEDIINNILDERAEMYNQYYHGKECRIADTMLPHVIYQFLDHFNLILRDGDIKDRELKFKILNEILKLTDQDFIRFINFIEEPWYAIDLLQNLLTGQIYLVCNEWNVFENYEEIRKQLIEISELVEKKKIEKNLENFEENKQKKIELHRNVFEEFENIKFETYLFHFLTNCIKEKYGKIFTVESDFWRNKIIQNEEIKEVVIYYGSEKSDSDKGEKFIEIPQVFIALPTYFPSFREITQYNYLPKEGEKNLPTLLYNPKKPITEENLEKYLDKRPSPKIVKSYLLYLLIPPYLKDFNDFINQEFTNYIKSLKWWEL